MLAVEEDMLNTCKRAIDKAIAIGAGEAEAYMLDKEIITIRLARSHIVEAKGIRDRGLALRVVKDKSISGVSTSLMDDKSIEKVAKYAISSAGMMHAKGEWQGLPTRYIPKGMLENGYDPAIEALSVDDSVRIAYTMLESATARADAADSLSVSGTLHVVKEHVCIEPVLGSASAELRSLFAVASSPSSIPSNDTLHL